MVCTYVNTSTDGTDVVLASGASSGDVVTVVAFTTFSVSSITVSDITDLTATATELNYTDGVTSAIQTQLDTKASTGKAIAMAIVFG